MKFDRNWRKLYRFEPLEQRGWAFVTRGLRDYLLRLPEDVDGYLFSVALDPPSEPTGVTEMPPPKRGVTVRNAERVIDTLIAALHVHEPERVFVAQGIKTLLEDRYLVVDEQGRVYIRNFEEAQRSKPAKRQKNYRDKKKHNAGVTPASREHNAGVTEHNAGVTEHNAGVTSPARARVDLDLDLDRDLNPPLSPEGKAKALTAGQGEISGSLPEHKPSTHSEPETPRKRKGIPGGGAQWKS